MRNIVLLSDGTDNLLAKLNKTNVWRLYQALDFSGDGQIAFYDDGVGTPGIRPLRLLGSAFGWGLSRGVCDLYEFLSEHYREGDQIYIFGVGSRRLHGAHARALIARCGLLDRSKTVPGRRGRSLQLNTREGLEAGVALAYRSYRRGYKAPVAQAWRWLRDRFAGPVPSPDEFRSRYGLARHDRLHRRLGYGRRGRPAGRRAVDHDRSDLLPTPLPGPGSVAAGAARLPRDRRRRRAPLPSIRCCGTSAAPRIPVASPRFGLPACIWIVCGGYPDNDLSFVSLHWMLQARRNSTVVRAGGLRFDQTWPAHDRMHGHNRSARCMISRRGLGVYLPLPATAHRQPLRRS